jgi:CRISPR-associated protein Cmr3
MTHVFELTPHDPLIARDGRPFGAAQGQRMKGLPWLLPSVVAGSFRTALVKSGTGDFSSGVPDKLLPIPIAGLFPVHEGKIYFPVPNDAVGEPEVGTKNLKRIHRVSPVEGTGCDFPVDVPLRPVMLPYDVDDFKSADLPTWWPLDKYVEWLLSKDSSFQADWLDSTFLTKAHQESRDHVALNADTGAAAESLLFATTGLNLTHMARYGIASTESFAKRFAKITLTINATPTDAFPVLDFNTWHPLGGERRMLHWQRCHESQLWECPQEIAKGLIGTRIHMTLATPAIFSEGWRPGWLDDNLEGIRQDVKLKLVGVHNTRWKAISGWSLAPPRGPKKIRRMVPAGSVYYFEVLAGDPQQLAKQWLKPVSDDAQECLDGFGLALWGTW